MIQDESRLEGSVLPTDSAVRGAAAGSGPCGAMGDGAEKPSSADDDLTEYDRAVIADWSRRGYRAKSEADSLKLVDDAVNEIAKLFQRFDDVCPADGFEVRGEQNHWL